MKKEEFRIPIAGLKEKVYHFEYELNESFFDTVDEPMVSEPAFDVHIAFDKTHEPYVLDFEISGDFIDECDRCASSIRIPIIGSYRLFIEFGEPAGDEDDETEVVYISREDHEIRLFEHIYDFVHLSIPMVKRCSTPEDLKRCDKKVKGFLKKIVIEEKEDPRWEALKKLKK